MQDNARIEAVRRFNRFYTQRVGVLNEGLLDSPFTLPEARVLWELAHCEFGTDLTATDLAQLLNLNTGYLSRLLKSLKERGLVRATRSTVDARQTLLELSSKGRKALKPLEDRAKEQGRSLLAALEEGQQVELLQAMHRMQALLDGARGKPTAKPFVLRSLRPGDIGWIISRHGALYARDHGWDMQFEALVARIAADLVDRFDSAREACWMAERDGANIGCICLVQARDEETGAFVEGTAQLRLLLVDPSARGLGLGDRLVSECHRFAQSVGYKRIRLWTNSQLDAAKHIYAKAGYRLVTSEPFTGFGQELVGETWELALPG